MVHRYLWRNIESAVSKALQETTAKIPAVLDVGCGNKPYADLFTGCKYIGVDISDEDSSPDIIGSATQIPVQDGFADIVISTQVIEHVPEPLAMVRECHRVLKKGGFFILTGPFYWPLHEEPFDFYRFTKYGFEHLLKQANFSAWDIKEDGGNWAQFFLSANLILNRRHVFLRTFLNSLGLVLDRVNFKKSSPSNYSILAKK